MKHSTKKVQKPKGNDIRNTEKYLAYTTLIGIILTIMASKLEEISNTIYTIMIQNSYGTNVIIQILLVALFVKAVVIGNRFIPKH